jgi:hypothetical protein
MERKKHDPEMWGRDRMEGKCLENEKLKVGPGTLGVLPQGSPHQEEIHQSC